VAAGVNASSARLAAPNESADAVFAGVADSGWEQVFVVKEQDNTRPIDY
jgi:hypothetical protein